MTKQAKVPAAESTSPNSSQPSRETKRRQRHPKSADGAEKRNAQRSKKFQPKLLVEEDTEIKASLVKITRITGIREVINYVLVKLKDDWKIEINGFSRDISKVLHATEILKTRIQFLHQETKFISQTKEFAAKGGEESQTKERIFSGLSVTLSKNRFKVTDQAGYQKPKPRQFVQPRPRQKAEEKKPEPPQEKQEDLKKPKEGKS